MAGAAGAGGPGGKPPRPDIGNQLVLLLAFMVAIFVLFDPSIRQTLGTYVGYGLEPENRTYEVGAMFSINF